MQSRDDDTMLGKRSVGTTAGHGGGLFLIWSSAALRTRGSRESFDHLARVRYRLPGVDPNPKAMWAPALVPSPLIGRHRSKCSWDAPSHTLKRCLVQRTQRSSNGDQPYYQALAGSATTCAVHSAFNNYPSPLRREKISRGLCGWKQTATVFPLLQWSH
jgi:hypothetical protein